MHKRDQTDQRSRISFDFVGIFAFASASHCECRRLPGRETGMNTYCLVVDDEESIRAFLSKVLADADVESKSCSDAETMLDALSLRHPALIFLDAALEGSDAVEALKRLASSAYKGAVQLISGRGPDILDDLRQIGEQYGLNMPMPLQKPFSVAQIHQALEREGITSPAPPVIAWYAAERGGL
jgi:FixJ family two-component response regulator